MRVHEYALRFLGRKMKIAVSRTIEYQDWQVIITAVESKARKLPSGSKAGSKSARAKEFYAEIAGYAFHIKEAWRVPGIHARKDYNPHEAMLIWDNTKALMQTLATKKL